MATCTYPIIVFDIDVSFMVKKVFHYSITCTFSSHMQGSHLMERKELCKEARNQLTSMQDSAQTNIS